MIYQLIAFSKRSIVKKSFFCSDAVAQLTFTLLFSKAALNLVNSIGKGLGQVTVTKFVVL